MEIKPLSTINYDELFVAFSEAFADYELQLDKEEHFAMLKRRGFDPALSFGAFDGDKLVSFTCNGIGDFYGKRTAYDTGTGTLAGYRGKGLATQVFEYSIPYLKAAGIEEYLLEVLQHNTSAVSVYRKIGFEVTREFYYFRSEVNRIRSLSLKTDLPYEVRQINICEYGEIPTFWDFKPSWQNSMESINRSPKGFVCLGVFADNKLVGYVVFEPASGDITQIAVERNHRRRGVGSLLFKTFMEYDKIGSIKIINTDVSCDSMTGFLKLLNIGPTGKQFEMIKKL